MSGFYRKTNERKTVKRMQPVSPVFESGAHGKHERVFAKDQPPYIPLPAVVTSNGVVTRWKPTFKERLLLIFGGSLYLQVLTFGQLLQPVKLSVEEPVLEDDNHAPRSEPEEQDPSPTYSEPFL